MDKKLIAISLVIVVIGILIMFYQLSSSIDEKIKELQDLGYQTSYRNWESFKEDFPSSHTIEYLHKNWNDFLTLAEDIKIHYSAHGATFEIFFDKSAECIWCYIPATYWIYPETFIYVHKTQ